MIRSMIPRDRPRPGSRASATGHAEHRHLRIRAAECRGISPSGGWHDIRSRDPSCAISSMACGCCGGPRDWRRRRSSRSASASAPPPPSSAWCATCCCARCPSPTPTAWSRCGKPRPTTPTRWVAPANFLDWQRDTASLFDGMAAYDGFSAAVAGDGEPERLRAVSASGTFFTVLGQQAQEGRTLDAADDRRRRAVRGRADRRVARSAASPIVRPSAVRWCSTAGRARWSACCRRRSPSRCRAAPSCGSTAIAACRAASRSRATSPPCATRTCSTSSAGSSPASRAARPRPRCRR